MTNIYYISLSSKLDVNEVPDRGSVHCAQGAGALGMPRDAHVEAVMQVCEPLLLHTAALQCLRRKRESREHGATAASWGFHHSPARSRSPRRSISLYKPPQGTSLKREPATGELPQGVKPPGVSSAQVLPVSYWVSSLPPLLGTNETAPLTTPHSVLLPFCILESHDLCININWE